MIIFESERGITELFYDKVGQMISTERNEKKCFQELVTAFKKFDAFDKEYAACI